jgi:hypothetical protein
MTPKASLISAASTVAAIAAVVGAYHGLTGWMDTRFISRAEASDSYERLSGTQALQYHETMVRLAELELAALEAEIEAEGDEPTAAQLRALERALDKIEFHETQLYEARERLSKPE